MRSGCFAALAAVCLVNDDGEVPGSLLLGDFVEDERELLDSADDDLLALFDEAAQIAGIFGVAYCGTDLHELLNRLSICSIKDAAVCYDDHGIENFFALVFTPMS